MRFGRLMAATTVVSFAAAGGLYALAPTVYGQAVIAAAKGEQGRTAVRQTDKRVDRVMITRDEPGPWQTVDDQSAVQGFASGDLMMFDGGGAQIGLAVRDVDTADVSKQKLPAQSGAVVEEVRRETAAAKAGVKSGDVVIAFDGERVRSARQLERLVEETPAGRLVKMSVMRAGAKLDLDVTPESTMPTAALTLDGFAPDMMGPKIRARKLHRGANVESVPAMPFEYATPRAFSITVDTRSRLGVQVDTVDDQLASYFGVDHGVLVRHVAEDSAAAKAGIKAGDVITAIAGKPVNEPEELRAALADVADGKDVALTVTREKKEIAMKATLEAPEKTRPRVRRMI